MRDGSVKVINQCRRADGTPTKSEGVARQLGAANSAKLEVQFAPSWLSFAPFVWGDYWVVDLDENYELAAVSEPNRKYLWILSRTRMVQPERYEALLERLRGKGFNLENLEPTRQP